MGGVGSALSALNGPAVTGTTAAPLSGGGPSMLMLTIAWTLACAGAALLAACGAGAFDSVKEACNFAIHVTDSVQPSLNRQVYESGYLKYHELYPALKDHFHYSENRMTK